MKRVFDKGRRGMSLIEIIIVLAIITIFVGIICTWIFYAVGGITLFHWAESQSVTDIDAIEAVEEAGYTNVRLIESFRTDPQETPGCAPADNAGFRLEGTNSDGQQVTLDLCCLGSTGKQPRCNLIN
ncbi:hypothetical protein CO174_01445 [Candidatus Uhrbacteria bacterium CG_4_9_14_3_um_filter_50_9]|uniref:Type II secretion system protein n=1 Tax=Candidatus Uhrbacteria bacterium CG_4_9_14_3_um_filter_50_9 TaxID=1975035 RepID=A0A2M7XDC0_9BACT|nr:MAG: hypothetical protein CO174_01445 [Candidatus Uhrbacteria bacterium CG_4_9_14_3_um_filter_50_9]